MMQQSEPNGHTAGGGHDQLLALALRRQVLLDAWNAPGPDIDDRAFEIFDDQLEEIHRAIAGTAAGDLAALRVKARVVEVLVKDAGGAFCGAQQALVESLLEDIERLAAEASL